uniref:G_PROTEIN_RECEP_F1_2 domain-containing protein n=1 Tax=Caenorhabditis tropicalis TaxID=1561998 RepID=A0A1I7UFF1_9PELO
MSNTLITGITNDSSCPFRASSDQIILQTSWILRLNIIYCTFLSIGCFIGIGYCIRYMRKHPIFNESTTVLLYLSLVFAVIHDVTHVCSQWAVMYRSFFYADDPCNLFFDSDDCYVFGRLLIFGISGMIYIHSALSLDGLLATFFPEFYYKHQHIPGVVLAGITIAFNILVQFIVLPGAETGKDYLPSCQFFKKQDAGRANVFLMSSLVVTFVNLGINLVLLHVNKRHSKRLV